MKLSDYEYFRNDLGVIYKGNNLQVLPLIKEENALLYTDPPYKISASGGGFFNKTKRKYIENIKKNVGVNFDPSLFLDIIKNRFNNIYIWCSKDLLYSYFRFAIENKYNYNLLTWVKVNPMPINNNTYLPDTEYCVFMRKGKTYFNSDFPMKYYKKCILTAVGKNNYGHPTEKPEKVIYNHIKISSPDNGLIIDPFFGSGTTGAVCEKLGRRWIGIEISEKYCEMAKQRINKNKGEPELNFRGEKPY